MFNVKELYKKARSKNKTIVFPEAGFSDRILTAVKILQKKKICKPILIGDESSLVIRDKSLVSFTIMNPKTSPLKSKIAKHIYSKRKNKGMTLEEAEKLAVDPYYFATAIVDLDIADGMVCGAETSTANTVRPALQIIKSAKKDGLVSSSVLLFGKNKFLKNKDLLLADCALVVEPTSEQLSIIASHTVETAKLLDFDQPKLAFLSYSSHGSASGEKVEKIKNASNVFNKPGVISDGELQFDSALNPNVSKIKTPNSIINGDANILIFPDLNSGNICYKAMQSLGGLQAVGPILHGLRKPVNDVSRGCSVEEILLTTAITVLQVKEKKV